MVDQVALQNAKAALKRLKEQQEKEDDLAHAIRKKNAQREANRINQQGAINSQEKNELAAPMWEEVEKAATEMQSRGMEAYNEWATAMANVLSGMKLMLKALSTQLSGPGVVTAGIRAFATEHVLPRVQKKFSKNQPELVHQVHIDEHGQIGYGIAKYEGEDIEEFIGGENGARLNNQLQAGFRVWAAQHGCEMVNVNPAGEEKFVLCHQGTQNPVTLQQFDDMNVNYDESLDAFFSNEFNVNFQNSSKLVPGN